MNEHPVSVKSSYVLVGFFLFVALLTTGLFLIRSNNSDIVFHRTTDDAGHSWVTTTLALPSDAPRSLTTARRLAIRALFAYKNVAEKGAGVLIKITPPADPNAPAISQQVPDRLAIYRFPREQAEWGYNTTDITVLDIQELATELWESFDLDTDLPPETEN